MDNATTDPIADLYNSLNGLVNSLDYLKHRLPEDDKTGREYIESKIKEIKKEIEKANLWLESRKKSAFKQ